MATFPIANGDICQVTIWCTYQSSKILNVLHYEAVVPGGLADGLPEVQSLLEKIRTTAINPAVGNKWRDWTVDQYRFNYSIGQIIYPTRRFYVSDQIELSGTLPGDGCPSNVGATASLQSSKVGRGRSGSKHFTGLDNADVAGGSLNAITRTNIQDTVDKLTTDIISADPSLTWKPRIWSNSHPGDINEIVSSYVWPEPRIMRRRTLHVGI